MNNNNVSSRVKSIVQKLCNEEGYVTIAAIAEELCISSKTVCRKIPEVEKWLQKHDYMLNKKVGVGLKIDVDTKVKEEILDLLNDTKAMREYSPNGRGAIITYQILLSDGPIKLYSLSTVLSVTESTISNDLDKVKNWLSTYEIELVRKPGLGILIQGSENNKRKAIVNLVYESLGEDLLLDIVRTTDDLGDYVVLNHLHQDKLEILDLLGFQNINKFRDIMNDALMSKNFKIIDNDFITLLVFLLVTYQRIKNNNLIMVQKATMNELKDKKEYIIAKKIASDIQEVFNVIMQENEIVYFANQLLSSQSQGVNIRPSNDEIGNFQIVRIAKMMIRVASIETGLFLEGDKKLLVGLVNHLGPVISKVKMNLDIRNPLLGNMRELYPDIFKLSKKCVKELETALNLEMPDEEIGYIAMHLGAAIENIGTAPKRVFHAVIACSAGMGTSMILAAKLRNSYSNIKIIDTVSILKIDEELLNNDDIDFIIATVKLEKCMIPSVTVNPLLLEEDREKIDEIIRKVSEQEKPINRRVNINRNNLVQKLESLSKCNDGIRSIINNFFVISDEDCQNKDDIIEMIGEIISKKEQRDLHNSITEALYLRESKGSTVISGYETIFFHSRIEGIQHLYFGVVKLRNNIFVMNSKHEAEQIKLGIVMLVPENSNDYYIEIMSFISRMLVENKQFMNTIKSGDEKDIYNFLSNMLEAFYTAKIRS